MLSMSLEITTYCARCDYYTNLIAENNLDQRKLFRTTRSLLSEPSDVSFLDYIPPNDLANNFSNYFVQKIDDISKSLDALKTTRDGNDGVCTNDNGACPYSIDVRAESADLCASEKYANFKSLTQDQVAKLIRKAANKSRPLDPMPTSVVLQAIDVLLPVITSMINISFETGHLAEKWREALVVLSLKKCGLDITYSNFRPVSNLQYTLKLSEKAATDQLLEHMTINGLHSEYQLAYKKHHSTQTALLKVKNEILMNTNAQAVTLLVLLDCSAAFDTVQHDILLERLSSTIGVAGRALSWLTSYLTDRSQRVAVNGGLSDNFPPKQGVPQGSCLGPVLFTVFTSKLFEIVERHLPNIHCYANDTQLYLAFSPNTPGADEVAVNAMRDCTTELTAKLDD